MRTGLLLSVLFCSAAWAEEPKKDAVKDEMKKLEGTWVVESATADGKAEADLKGGQAVFAGDKLTLKGPGDKVEKFTYKVDPAQKPKTLHLTPEKKEKNAGTGKAIYELDGDTLKVCIGPPDKFPTEFTDKGHTLIVLKRKK